MLSKQEVLAREIDDNDKIASRYEAMIDDPNSTDFERILDKYKTAVSKSKKLREDRAALEREISSQNTENDTILSTVGLDVIRIDRRSKEGRLKLRSYLAQRISRIDVKFGETVVTAGPKGEGDTTTQETVATVTFVNGATKWIYFHYFHDNQAILYEQANASKV